LSTSTSSYDDKKNIFKYVFEKNEIENRRTKKSYWQNEAGGFSLRSQKDSVFNDQDCLVERFYIDYNEDGSILYGLKWGEEFTDDCKILQSDFSRWNANSQTMLSESQQVYEYFNEGKLMTIDYLRFNENINQWVTEHLSETEFNDDGEITRYFIESHRNNRIDTTLQLYTFTPRNKIESFEQFETVNTTDGRLFRRTRKDSFSYHYNLQDLLILEEQFIRHYENIVIKNTTTYEYYCNGQLKSEIRGNDEPYNRKDYRYVGGVDCPLADTDEAIILFPNPTSGIFTIQSNLLANSEATIQVFTILGQEVFSEKINQTSYQYQIDLTKFGKGNYIVMISNSEEMLSEKVILL
jgi:hypothetical protein